MNRLASAGLLALATILCSSGCTVLSAQRFLLAEQRETQGLIACSFVADEKGQLVPTIRAMGDDGTPWRYTVDPDPDRSDTLSFAPDDRPLPLSAIDVVIATDSTGPPTPETLVRRVARDGTITDEVAPLGRLGLQRVAVVRLDVTPDGPELNTLHVWTPEERTYVLEGPKNERSTGSKIVFFALLPLTVAIDVALLGGILWLLAGCPT
jgi:hypothetical protein